MGRTKLILISLFALIALPGASSLQSIILVREAVTAAHLQSVAGTQEQLGHPHDTTGVTHSHKHRHSPSEPEHEHRQVDPSVLSAFEFSPGLSSTFIAIIERDSSEAREPLVSDQIPLSLAFASPLRPPIA